MIPPEPAARSAAVTDRERRFPVGATVAVAICIPILIALGVWQVQRLAWKTDLLARIAAVEHAAPQPIAPVLAKARTGADIGFTRVTAVCRGLAAAPFVELHSISDDGTPGVRLISVCRTPDAGEVLADRGFVAETISARPSVDAAASAPVLITGVLRKAGKPSVFTPPPKPGAKLWLARDAAGMASALGAPGAPPQFLVAETSSNPEWKALDPQPLPKNIPNNHLGYALTWFGLAAALAGVYAGMLVRWRRARTAAGDSA